MQSSEEDPMSDGQLREAVRLIRRLGHRGWQERRQLLVRISDPDRDVSELMVYPFTKGDSPELRQLVEFEDPEISGEFDIDRLEVVTFHHDRQRHVSVKEMIRLVLEDDRFKDCRSGEHLCEAILANETAFVTKFRPTQAEHFLFPGDICQMPRMGMMGIAELGVRVIDVRDGKLSKEGRWSSCCDPALNRKCRLLRLRQ